MADTVVVVAEDRREELERYINRLPDILSGNAEDTFGIVPAIHARVAYTLLGFISTAFEEKGRGGTDEAGESWAPLSKEYLAYKRPVIGRGPPRAGKLGPGGNDGYMTAGELKRWNAIYAHTLAWALSHYDADQAAAIAGGKAWNDYKKRGGKTKIGTFGERKAGTDYQTLVDTGNLRRSLQVGMLTTNDGGAEYSPKNSDQIYESRPSAVTIGSRDRTAAFHHYGKKKRRRLWPEHFPAEWWREVMGQVTLGVAHFADFFGRRA